MANEINNLISPSAADKLIAAHDGDVALLCIHALRNGALDADKAAHDLCRTLGEIRAAEEKLMRLDILPRSPAPQPAMAAAEKLPPDDSLPEYTTQDVILRSEGDPTFSAILQEAARVFGHSLSSPDLKRLFGIYDFLALPAEVIYLLLNYCSESVSGRRLSMRYVEKEAYKWVNREIYTYEQAEEYIARCRTRNEAMTRIAEGLGLKGRSLTQSERGYISSWLDMGMEDGAIFEAYDRTVLSTNKLSWSYLDRILQSWHSAGIHTLAEAEQRDPRRKSAAPAAVKSSAPKKVIDLEELIKPIQ